MPELAGFHLVGGTALAIRYEHRTSVDLDLFCNEQPDFSLIRDALKAYFGADFVFENALTRVGIFAYIRNVKADIVYFPHPIIEQLEIGDGISLYSDADIAAMKVNAILGRGRKKDFWDMALLLNKYSLEQIIEWHSRKFPSHMLLISIPDALSYFADAEESETPVSLQKLTWAKVKKTIAKAVRDYLK